jgi:hypothetical protein
MLRAHGYPVADADAASQDRQINVHRHYSFALRDPGVPGEISRGDVSAHLSAGCHWYLAGCQRRLAW